MSMGNGGKGMGLSIGRDHGPMVLLLATVPYMSADTNACGGQIRNGFNED